jgi:hypothetical protein
VCLVLTKYLPKAKVRKEKNLLGGSVDANDDNTVEEVAQVETIVSHWHKVLEDLPYD